MTNGWSAAQIKAAIDRCEGDCEAAIARHEDPARIKGMRKGIEKLHKWLARAESEEHNGQVDGLN